MVSRLKLGIECPLGDFYNILVMDERMMKKIARKTKHCEEILFKHRNLQTSKEITNSLFIGNGGLGCGFDRESLMDVFKPYGLLENIVVLPGEPYAFVTFIAIEDAIKAMKSVNGQKINDHIFYMSYINSEDVPQLSLKENSLPPGLILINDFLNEEEEKEFLETITFDDVCDEKAILKHRKVKHYGYEFIYGSNNIDKNKRLDEKIPDVCIPHLQRLVTLRYLSKIPDQLTVNHYLSGQGIPPHIDTHSPFEDGIVSVSLGSQVVMDFYGPGKECIPVLLPRRSALIMLRESRYLWKHGITPRKTDIIPITDGDKSKLILSQRSTRISLTFRIIRSGKCHCEFKEQCDSQRNVISTLNDVVSNEKAQELENRYVNQVYEEIADHFSNTRYKPWPKVASFLKNIPPGSVILDVGCGNGKNMKLSSVCFEIGCDASLNLVQLCSKRNVQVLAADCLRLPFRNESIDAVICIAVIHHLSTKVRRKKAVEEILRVLRSGGRALIYVWSFEQESSDGQSKYLKTEKQTDRNVINSNDISSTEFQIFEKACLPVHKNKTSFQQQDVLVPWKKKSKDSTDCIHHRYYHVFVKDELELLISECSAKIISSYYDEGNWCVILTK
ncbi:alkylated DNA repair protein alkB homolog 8 [Nephila pilipes]|uniref:tRNA (carboxymethyluridine(34)-5-O)-methyltransferase n=1 Tax=Nephila pilipes TaxID=299642 RepID=A0A8X6MTF3_NEPPI|nr:alkylated DNA repair protein alkB homolog 8 [Nephila pilipes]